MKLRTAVRSAIAEQESGELFTAKDIAPAGVDVMDISKSLSLFYRRGLIEKFAKGLYYKPVKSSITGMNLGPSLDEVLRKLEQVQRPTVWYVTGTYAYNALFLTTQVSTVLTIATDKPRTPVSASGTTITFVNSRLSTPVEFPTCAQVLDALMEIRRIPATTPRNVCEGISRILKQMTDEERRAMAAYVVDYPPRVNALLGLCFDLAGFIPTATTLRENLKKTKEYHVGVPAPSMPTTLSWNIR